jgi:DNA mismatch endonuclease, patch repair protein
MPDILSPDQRSRRMASVRQRNTDPEQKVRRLLHLAGFRFRIGDRRLGLPGTPDIVLPRWRAAIFVNGCFWHGHDCALFKLPDTRTEWWRAKVAANVQRDNLVIQRLVLAGWRVITVWQCCLKGKQRLSESEIATLLTAAVRGNAKVVELSAVQLSLCSWP